MVYPPEDGQPSTYQPGPTWVNFVHATNAANHYAKFGSPRRQQPAVNRLRVLDAAHSKIFGEKREPALCQLYRHTFVATKRYRERHLPVASSFRYRSDCRRLVCSVSSTEVCSRLACPSVPLQRTRRHRSLLQSPLCDCRAANSHPACPAQKNNRPARQNRGVDKA